MQRDISTRLPGLLFGVLVMGCAGSDAASGANNTLSMAGTAGAAMSSSAGMSTAGADAAGANSASSAGAGGAAAGGTLNNGGTSGSPAMAGSAPGGAGAAGEGSGGEGSGGEGAVAPEAFVGCSLAEYQLCDDFEGAEPGSEGSVWNVKGGFPVEVVTDQAHSGTRSVRIRAEGGGAGAIEETMTFPATDYWVRVYIRLEAEDDNHEGFVVANGQPESFRLLNNNGVGDGPNGPNGKGKVMIDRTSDDRGFKISVTTDLPKATWNCWEWHETPDTIYTYLDGVEIEDVRAPWPVPNISSLSFGFERYHQGGLGYIWYDDIAVDSERIGCN